MNPKQESSATVPTPAQLREWAMNHKSLANALTTAQTFAHQERTRIDSYILPIFQSFNFVDDRGEKIKSPSDLYLSNDEAMCAAFYAQCESAHRAHGFTGPEGHCPALKAEHAVIQAENTLLQAGCAFLNIQVYQLAGDKRKQMVELLLKVCTNAQ